MKIVQVYELATKGSKSSSEIKKCIFVIYGPAPHNIKCLLGLIIHHRGSAKVNKLASFGAK